MLKAELQNRSYIIEVPPAIWEVLTDIDDEGYENDEYIMKDLEDMGAYKIEWNAHFGRAVFFSLMAEDDDNLDEIIKYISNLSNKE